MPPPLGDQTHPDQALTLSPIRAALFLLLPNDLVWSWLLTERERRLLLAVNVADNDERSDYTPDGYQKGNNFDSDAPRCKHDDGKWIVRFLEAYAPGSVLECGPGSGFHTRAIVEHPSVSQYTGVDVNRSFINYLEHRLEPYRASKRLSFRLILGDVKGIHQPPVDAVIFSASLHHIPDRKEVFQKLAVLVKPGGYVCCVEPTHYLPRLLHLWRKVVARGYLRGMGNGQVKVATHNFCTWREFKQLARSSNAFEVREVDYDGYRDAFLPRALGKLSRLVGIGWPVWLRTSLPVRIYSRRMMIVFRRR